MAAYKLILRNSRIYREIALRGEENAQVSFGTEAGCQLRFQEKSYFGHFLIDLNFQNDKWILFCSEEVYVTADGTAKQYSLTLEHGMEFSIKREGVELFRASFLLDFDEKHRDYNCVIDISGQPKIGVGAHKDCQIRIDDPMIGDGYVVLTKREDGCLLEAHHVRYGVYVNGAPVETQTAIRDYDFFSLAGHSFFLLEGRLYTEGEDKSLTVSLPNAIVKDQNNHLEYPKFNRATRIQYQVPVQKLEILPPEKIEEKKQKSLLFSLIPALIMLSMTILLRGILNGGSGSSKTFVLYSVVSMSVGIVVSIVTYVTDKKEVREENEKKKALYEGYIAGKEEEIARLRTMELKSLQTIHLSIDDNIRNIHQFDKRLFEKSPGDPDFLTTRLGTGRIPSCNQIQVKEQDYKNQDPAFDIPDQLAEKYRYLEDAPVVIDLKRDNAVGFVGSDSALERMLKTVALDLASRHFYREVKFVCLLGEDNIDKFEWIRWLPHFHSDDNSLRYIAYNQESRDFVLEEVYAQLSERESQRKQEEESGAETEDWAHYVVFVLHSQGLARHPISQYFQKGTRYGFTFLFFDSYPELLPMGCGEVVYARDEEGTVVQALDGREQVDFRYMLPPDHKLQRAVLKLSAAWTDEISLESELTKNITLYQMLGILSANELNLDYNWKNSKIYQSMSVPLGVRRGKELIYLDISDKASAHGPHGLVAGTTGSGKSELLQTYILSMAAKFHPYDVGFMIIDFKGGGMANQFLQLPHLLGNITNIDGREINRSLLSIKAESLRRQTIFAQYGVQHINDYIKLFKQGKAKEPLPHLVIIVDEFAELKMAYSEFMSELVSTARIGRTLGVHLILATQKPSGQVDPQIWSNSRFKLCLKVQSREDSSEMLKSPLAAEIKEPGRAYLQVGNNEIFELFQSAYAGAEIPDPESMSTQAFSISKVELWGKREVVYTNRLEKSDEKRQSQLQEMVEYMGNCCEKLGIERLPSVCLPPLKDVIRLSDIRQPEAEPGVKTASACVAVGLYDDPEQHAQSELVIDFAQNHYIVGSGLSGKTSLLQTILLTGVMKYSPEELNFYVVDCGNQALKSFEESKHVGGVVLVSQEERMRNLFKMLRKMADARRESFSKHGLGTYEAYREAGFTDVPRAVVIIDSFASFKEYYEDLAGELLSLTREGQSVGITYIVTANMTNAVNMKTQMNFGVKLALNCNDPGEYSNILGHCRMTPKEVPGRGLCLVDRRVLEFQAALCIEGLTELERVNNLKCLLALENEKYSTRAAAIPVVPDTLDVDVLCRDQKVLYNKGDVVLGLDFEEVEPVILSMASMGVLTVTGAAAGRNRFTDALLYSISQTVIYHGDIEATVLDDMTRPLKEAKGYGFVKDYTNDTTEGLAYISDFKYKLDNRRELAELAGDRLEEILGAQPLLLLVVENKALMQMICDNKNAASAEFIEILRMAKAYKAMVICSNVDNAAVSTMSTASAVLKLLKEEKRGILFDTLGNSKFFDVSTSVKLHSRKGLGAGEAYYFTPEAEDGIRVRVISREVHE